MIQKSVFLILLLSLLSRQGYSQLPIRTIEPGIHAVYGDNVLIRKAPNQKGTIEHIIPIGTKVDVIKKASVPENISNTDDYWYQIVYDLDTGYVWGALISENFLEGDLDGDSNEEIFLSYCNTFFNGTDYKYMEENSRIEFKVARNNLKISELKLKTSTQYLLDSVYLRTFSNFDPPFQAICLTDSFIDGDWGKGELYLRFNDNSLDSLFHLDIEAGEGGFVHRDSLILPASPEGIANTLIIKTSLADYTAITPENPETKWDVFSKYYRWDGKKFTLFKEE